MTRPMHERVERVPAVYNISGPGLCTGCIFERKGECQGGRHPSAFNEFRAMRVDCRTYNGSDFKDFIFIRRTPAARAAYAALILEHGLRP